MWFTRRSLLDMAKKGHLFIMWQAFAVAFIAGYLLIAPNLALAAITFDSGAQINSSGTICTVGGTAPTNGFLAVGLVTGETTDTVTSIEWNGQPLTEVQSFYNSDEGRFESLYYLESPDTGSHNLVINFSTSVGACYGYLNFYKSDSTSIAFDSSNRLDSASVTTLSTTNNSSVDDTWQVLYGDSGGGTPSCNGSTVRNTTFGNNIWCDSNGSTGAAGTKTLTFDNTSSQHLSGMMLGFYESGSGGGGGGGTAATSTVDQAQDNLYHAFIIFFITMGFMVWMFKKRS